MTKKQKQEMLNHLVKTLDGKGRAHDEKGCLYFPKKHPGCAIGCQPGFRKKFGRCNFDTLSDFSISKIIEEHSKGEAVREFFNVRNDEDIDFLMDLQELHDTFSNWSRKSLKSEAIAHFCEEHELKVPKISK